MDARLHPQGKRWSPEGLSTSHSPQAAVSRRESPPTPALPSLAFKWGRAGVWVQWARRRRPLHQGVFAFRGSGRNALLSRNREVRLPPQGQLGLGHPMSLFSPGWSPFFPTRF